MSRAFPILGKSILCCFCSALLRRSEVKPIIMDYKILLWISHFIVTFLSLRSRFLYLQGSSLVLLQSMTSHVWEMVSFFLSSHRALIDATFSFRKVFIALHVFSLLIFFIMSLHVFDPSGRMCSFNNYAVE